MASMAAIAPRRRAQLGAALLALLSGMFSLVVLAPPAQAEGSFCSGQGVNVAVDYKSLGGGVQQTCVEDGGGKTASEVFKTAGFELTPVGAFPGAACQVDGKPEGVACAKMPPANAYWGLYISTNGKWGYAPKGANELKLADGDYVAFAWQSTNASVPPAVAPTPSPASAAPATSENDTTSSSDGDGDGGGIPWWIPAGVVVVLAGAGGAVALRRSRS